MTLTHMRRERFAARRGASLIEVVIVVGVLTLVLTINAVTLHSLLRVGRAERDGQTAARAWTRLALAFRSDAHQALSLETAAAPRQRLSFDSGARRRVSYEVKQSGGLVITRTARRGDDVIGRETYTLGKSGAGIFEIAEIGDARLARLTLSLSAASPLAPRTRVIDALVGRDRIGSTEDSP